MDTKTFNEFRRIVYEKSGIRLDETKMSLVTARVGKRLRMLGIADHKSYLKHLVSDDTGEEIVEFLNVISTNVTNFFREPSHFEVLDNILRKSIAEGKRRLRLWSAACSSGEEPFTMAMVAAEACDGDNAIDIKILATDISTKILAKSCDGVYTEAQMEPVPSLLRRKYFEEVKRNGVSCFRVRAELRQMVTFKRLNLACPPFPMRGPLDVAFCRNVMIYFDEEVRKRLVSDIHRLLRPGGFLMVGHAETLTGLQSGFNLVHPAVYVK